MARLCWRLRDIDLRSVLRSHVLLDEALRRAGLGYLRLRKEQAQEWQSSVEPAKHHMGTTRMHEDPARGVVDRDCRVHGVENLFIAGSSVFPSAGFANPTLTIVALSLRLADICARSVRMSFIKVMAVTGAKLLEHGAQIGNIAAARRAVLDHEYLGGRPCLAAYRCGELGGVPITRGRYNHGNGVNRHAQVLGRCASNSV